MNNPNVGQESLTSVRRRINRAFPQTDAIDRWPASPARPLPSPRCPPAPGASSCAVAYRAPAGARSLPAVACSAHRDDAIGAELAPEVSHVDVHDVRAG